MRRWHKTAILLVVNTIIIVFSNVFSYFFIGPLVGVSALFYFSAMILQIVLYLICAAMFHLLNRVTRFFGLKEIIKIGIAAFCTSISESALLLFVCRQVSFRHIFLANFLAMVGIIFVNIFWRMFVIYGNSKRKGNLSKNSTSISLNTHQKRVLIIGAGEAGFQLMQSFDHNTSGASLDIVGFIDDDPSKISTYISWKKVLGSMEQLNLLIKEYDIEQVIFAIPSLSYDKQRKMISMAMKTGVKVTTLPHIADIALGKLSVNSLKEVDVVDLLGREEVKLDMDGIYRQLRGKTVLVTGAGGSIGSEIVRQLLQFQPAKLLLLGHGEYSIYKINSEIRKKTQGMSIEIVPIIADIKDIKRIDEIMREYSPEIVYHAAAYKHVPLMEDNSVEAVNNNIYGTFNVAKLAKQCGVKNFVMISTDKAVNPTNVMGATKRIAEMMMMSFNEVGKTKFSAVRFGNVLGSRGSVIPLFKRQIAAGGPVTITDFRMTRFFMTIPEASRLVLQSGALSNGGEIFVLDMGEPVKIKDLAAEMIHMCGRELDEISIVETGIRPGEKLYEELFLENEKNSDQVYEKIFMTNIEQFELEEIQEFLNTLPSEKEKLAKAIVEYANK
ncbi:MAG: polysaccharide biosynthesis protein [Streptococcaceae bacterium]|nr:polysaccharide biosynthesis protein [Streptococcaceae bacterium]